MMERQTVATSTALGGRVLMVDGVVAALLGVFAWGWDVDPGAGKAWLAVGAVSALAGWWANRSGVSTAVSRVLLVVAVVLAVVVVTDAVHLVQLSNLQRGGSLA